MNLEKFGFHHILALRGINLAFADDAVRVIRVFMVSVVIMGINCTSEHFFVCVEQ